MLRLVSISAVLLVTLSITGCFQDKTKSVTALAKDFETLTADTSVLTMKLTDIANHITYVPLESTGTNLIGKVEKIELWDGFFFILDKRFAKSFFLFDKTGKFIYQKKAKTGELSKISSISDFSIDRNNRVVYLFANDQKLVMGFDIRTGNLLYSFPIKGYFSQLALLDSHNFLFFRDGLHKYDDKYGEYRVCLMNEKGTLIKRWMDDPINPYVNAGEIVYGQNNTSGPLLFTRTFLDTIYSVKNEAIEAAYKVDVGTGINSTAPRTIKDQNGIMAYLGSPSSSYITGTIFSTTRILGFYIKFNTAICLYYYNKEVNKGHLIRNFINDIDNTLITLPNFMNDSCFVSSIDAMMLQQQYSFVSSKPDFSTKFAKLIALNKEINAESNPVLAIVDFK
jgi:hypothetical protein